MYFVDTVEEGMQDTVASCDIWWGHPGFAMPSEKNGSHSQNPNNPNSRTIKKKLYDLYYTLCNPT